MLYFIAIIAAVTATIVLLILLSRYFISKKPDQIVQNHLNDPERESVFMKKFPEADISRFRGTFFRMGLAVSLLMVILAFNWTTYTSFKKDLGEPAGLEDFEITPPITVPKKVVPPKQPVEDQVFKPVDDEVEKEIEEEEKVIEEEVQKMIENPVFVIPGPETTDENVVWDIASTMPQFIGGDVALMEYLGKTRMPHKARELGYSGTVVVEFVIDVTGKVINVQVAKSSGYKILDETAVSHIKKMPDWIPGMQGDKPAKVRIKVPIRFVVL